MKQNKKVKYEDAAIYVVDIEGWACKNCGRFWGTEEKNPGAEHMAKWCCANDLPCGCGERRTNKFYTVCDKCRMKNESIKYREKIEKAKTVTSYAGPFMIDDEFYFDIPSYFEHCENYGHRPNMFLFVPRKTALIPSLSMVLDDMSERSEIENWDATAECSGIAELEMAWKIFEKSNKYQFSYCEDYKEKITIEEDIESWESFPDFEGWGDEDEDMATLVDKTTNEI